MNRLVNLVLACTAALCIHAADQPNGAARLLATTHVVELHNGRSFHADLVERASAVYVFALGSQGTFTVPLTAVAAVREEPGSLSLHPAPPPPPAEPDPAPPRPPVEPDPAPIDRLEPPPAPEELQDDIAYWIHHLGRQRAKNRIQAERHLKIFGPAAIEAVLPYAARPEWLVRSAALRILGASGHPSAAEPLYRALDDPHPVVRTVALEQLQALTGRRIPFDPVGSAAARRRAAARWESALHAAGLLRA